MTWPTGLDGWRKRAEAIEEAIEEVLAHVEEVTQ
jgi:hypothetical protein